MSRTGKRNSTLEHSATGARLMIRSPRRIFVLFILGTGLVVPALAQYPGRVDPNKSAPEPVLRSTAVLEYTGDYTKPIASRLIPVAVWDGERYQPGGLYMAQPMPLAVESGTQYELFDAGASRGLFDVKAAANVSGSWIAVGNYQKPVPPRVAKLRASKNLPQMMRDGEPDDGKPHFAHRPADSPAGSGSSAGNTTTGSTTSGSTTGTAPATDPDKPTLHRRTDSGSSTSGSGSDTQTGSGSTSASSSAPPVDPDRPTLHRKTDDTATAQTGSASPGSPAQTSSDSGNASSSAPDVDPDRPTLHRHSTAANANDNGAPVSATTEVDPDRPRLKRGRPEDLESLDVPSTVEIAKLSGNPENLKLMAAVSDIKTRVPHSFVYSWSDPDDMKKAQAALEDTARNLLSGKPLQPQIAGKSASAATSAKPAPAKPSTTSHATHRTGAKTPVVPRLELKDEQFKAYELSFGSGATLVFSASSGEGDAVKYVTLIAQPDFNGTPQVIWKQVTSGGQLDVTPRMQLVDAVDTDADNRAELIFELAGKTDRQFAIYRVADHSVEQVFTTGNSE